MNQADYVFFDLTRSTCPECLRLIDAHVLTRDDNRVYMRKRCPDHGVFECLVHGDAEAYVETLKMNKPGSIPERYSTNVDRGCPWDCGLCPDHQQHACVGIIEITSRCNMACPLCFADAGPGFDLSLSEVEEMLDHFIATEGSPEVVQFSGGEPTLHPEFVPMLQAAKERGIPHVMVNTNGKRIATDDRLLEQLETIRPSFYFQFDGLEAQTYQQLRGDATLLKEKTRALDRLAEIGCHAVLVPAIERGVNEHEVGAIIEFALSHPAVKGINFQPAFHAGRFGYHDPRERMTNPDILRLIEMQSTGRFLASDFVPVPCCFPTCSSATYAYVDDDGTVTPLPRLVDVEDYMDYIANRSLPDVSGELRTALETLWSSSAVPGSDTSARSFALSCSACGLTTEDLDIGRLSEGLFMIMLQDFMDPWTFDQKNVMKCCKEVLLPGGRQVPFCAYNSLGYRKQARVQLAAREEDRVRARRQGRPYVPSPLTFTFEQR